MSSCSAARLRNEPASAAVKAVSTGPKGNLKDLRQLPMYQSDRSLREGQFQPVELPPNDVNRSGRRTLRGSLRRESPHLNHSYQVNRRPRRSCR
jgi:hypothetical protein